MAEKEGAGSSTDGQSQNSATADGSQGSGDDVVPMTRFLAAIRSANEKNDVLTAEIKELKAKQAAPAPEKVYTRAELAAAVTRGEITQAAADEYADKHVINKAVTEATKATQQANATAELTRKLNDTLSGYRELVPEAWEAGSSKWKAAKVEFDALVELGQPNNQITEAVAMRAAFGSLETLRSAKSARRGSSESHVEVGGGEEPPQNTSDMPKGLDAKQKAYYTRQIQSGLYKDWKEVSEELKFQRK